METPDVPVNEKAKHTSPILYFILAVYFFCLGSTDVFTNSNGVFKLTLWRNIFPLFYLFLGLNAWKGREATQLILNYFPTKRRESIYYLLALILGSLLMIFFAGLAVMYLRSNFLDKVGRPDSSAVDFIDVMACVYLCWVIYAGFREGIKNYRLYKAALPQT